MLPVHDVMARPGDGLEGDAPRVAVQPRPDDAKQLGVLHQVTLDALVDGPVVTGAVLRHDSDDGRFRLCNITQYFLRV